MKAAVILLVLFLIIALPLAMLKSFPKEHFTELYFNNPENLPKIIKINEEYNFSFTVVSHEKELKQYAYSIDSKPISENDKISLSPGENKTTTKSIKAEETGEGNVTITLNDREIHFFYHIFE